MGKSFELEEHRRISFIGPIETLRSEIRQTSAPRGTVDAGLEGQLEQLPYALAGAAFAAIRLTQAEARAVESVRGRAGRIPGTKQVGTYQLEDGEVDEASFAVDGYLDAARRAQNSLRPYLDKVLKTSAPKSLADTAKWVDQEVAPVPSRIAELIRNYWQASGKAVKEYRDLGQHYAVVSSDGRVTLLPNDRVGVYLVLPNNPAVRAAGKLKYSDPRIDALPWVWDSYWSLYAFVYELAHVLLSYVSGSETRMLAFRFKGPLRMGRGIDAHPPIEFADVVGDLTARQAKLAERLDAELPRLGIEPTLVVPASEEADDATGS
jgi:hypothetical protein